MTINRRGFLGAILATASAPAIVRAASMMKIWIPPEPEIYRIYPAYGEDWTSIVEMHRKDIESSIFFAQKNSILPGMIPIIAGFQMTERVLVTSVAEMNSTAKVSYKKIARMVK